MAEEEIRVKSTPAFKLKDHPKGRSWQGIMLKKQFGFVPDVIIIEKLPGHNNYIVVRAVLTPEEIKKEDIEIKEKEKVKKMILDADEAKNDKKIKKQGTTIRSKASKKIVATDSI